MATKKGDDQAVLDRPAEQSLATVGSSDVAVFDYGNDAGAGLEDLSSKELLVPIYRILGSNSPACMEGDPKHIPGARPGMIFNTALEEVYDGKETGIIVIPVKREHYYVERIPFDNGGQFIGVWAADDPRISRYKERQGDFGTLKLENGNELAETRSLLVETIHPDGTVGNGAIPFQSTQLKKYKSMMTRFTAINNQFGGKLPLFALRWRFKTKQENNNKNQKWMGWVITLEGGSWETAILPPDNPLYRQARDFYEMLRTGDAKVDYASDADAHVSEREEADQPF